MQRVRKSVRVLPFKRPHVLLACSAGKDSVALASILGEMQRLELVTLSIAHIHHGQHHCADAAAEAVQSIAKTLGTQALIHHLEKSAIEAHTGVGLEEALRRERYLALAQIASSLGADCIALAHHEADQAETILLHLMRGSGLDGLAGMREWELRQIPWWKSDVTPSRIGIWRPILREKAQDIETLARQSGLPIVEDPTNVDTAYRRNAIRHELLPVLERISPGSIAAIARTAGLLAGDAEYLHDQSNAELDKLTEDGTLNRRQLMNLPEPMQRRVVRAWITRSQPDIELSLERIDGVLLIAANNRGGAQVELGAQVTIRLSQGRLELNTWQNRDE